MSMKGKSPLRKPLVLLLIGIGVCSFIWFFGQMVKGGKRVPGLMEGDRQTLYAELVFDRKQARAKAEELEYDPEARKMLIEEYESRLAEKYGLTIDQVKEIGLEGFEKRWPKTLDEED